MNFLDTNIILRFVLQDHPIYSPKAEFIFDKINKGEDVYTSWLVIFETIFVLLHTHKLNKTEVAEKLLPLLRFETLHIENRSLVEKTFDYFVQKNVSFGDAYSVALMEKKKLKKIYSFDRDFDKFPQIKRLEK